MVVKNCCANCGGKFGLVCHYYWGMRFCCKACKKDFTRIRKWFWFLPVGHKKYELAQRTR